MTDKVALFPGQGIPASTVLEALNLDHELIDAAGEILGYSIVKKVEVSARRKNAMLPTVVAQPAIFTASAIGFERLSANESFAAITGHSLGEYAALFAGDAMSFEDALGVVKTRGEAMSAAARLTPGGMLAVLGLDRRDVDRISGSTDLAVANDNAPGQVALSGPEDRLAAAAGMARSMGGRSVLLQVEGAFHTSAMAPAVQTLHEALEDVSVRTPKVPVVSNVTARPYRDPGEIRKLLVRQLVSRVRFRESLQWLWSQGVRGYVDAGPGDVVAGLADRTFGEPGRVEEAVGV